MLTSKEKYDLKLLYSIQTFLLGKSTKIESYDNILIKYLKAPRIIREDKNEYASLKAFINELITQIDNKNDIILPFIEPFYDLIDIYINTDNNIEKEIWEKLFLKLIENSFFNKEYLIPIYSYFSELYSEVEKIDKSDEKIGKFKRVVELWKLIYLKSQNKTKSINSNSSFCSLGSGLEIFFPSNIPDEFCINVRINFITKNFLEYVNPNDFFIKTFDDELKYQSISHVKNIEFIELKVKTDYNTKILYIFFNNQKASLHLNQKNPKVIILNNFIGQIKSIQISFYDYNKNQGIISKQINPYPLKDNGGTLFFSTYKCLRKKMNMNQHGYNFSVSSNEDGYKFSLELRVQNISLFKTNYINMKEQGFDKMNYFGGIIQFLPFLNIINGLYKKKIFLIDNNIKQNVLLDFVKNILLVIFNYFKNEKDKELKFFDKYWIFFLYIINKIEIFKYEKIKIDMNEFTSDKTNIYIRIIKSFLENINDGGLSEKNSLKNIISSQNCDNFSILLKTNNQLYRHILKQLFVYNKLWSKQYLFFQNAPKCFQIYNNKEKNPKIKYKRLNYYTANFQQPFIYPILEIKKYYPKFKKFKQNNLYKNQSEETLDYDFSLDKFKNCLTETFIKEYLDKDNKDIKNVYECCLIKKMYHVKGRIGWIIDNENKNFMFYFLSDEDYKQETCNKKDNSGLCFGSIFQYTEKEKKRIIFLPKEKIVFALKRIYYQRISGLEIFTSDNKSYYFNFKEEFHDINKEETNNIIKILNENFETIIMQNKNINNKTLGWYNPGLEKFYFPLFSENIYIWDVKHIYSNFDKLMIVNLFSNRSFNDLNQYPVFPMLYNEIGWQRNMEKPIGFQDISTESKDRTQIIQDSFYYEKEYRNENEDNEDLHFFSILFSNIIYVCNYLIRVYPYSFLSIEVQGDGFDASDRLFYSIKSVMENTLTQRSDLRELIPEMFYFPPLFSNMNNIELNKLSNGNTIDNVEIQKRNEDKIKKYIFLKNMRNNLEKEENLNKWIDLIFGVSKEFNEKNERYYNSDRNVEFISKPEFIKDNLMMQSCDFGVLPLQLFFDKFPEQNKIDEKLSNEILSFNCNQFNNDHFVCLTDEKISFICKGEKGINSKYLELINKSKNEGILKSFWNTIPLFKSSKNNSINYLFTGDVFGNLFIYKKTKDELPNLININQDFFEICSEREILDGIVNQKYQLLNKLSDHTKVIKYIDYNPILNLLADYSLDGFINLYIMPSLKLIRAIQTKDLNIPGKIEKIALISCPLPLLCVVSSVKITVLDINGEFIRSKDIKKGNKVEFSVDKNCGRINDCFILVENGKRTSEFLI